MSLVNSVIHGALWMAFARVLIRVMGLVSTIILARLLAPEDFGLLSLAVLLISAPETVSNLTAESVLIQKQGAQRDDYNAVWTMRIIRGFFLAAFVIAMAAPMAWWFAEPRLPPVLICVAIASCLLGFSNIGIIDFQKNLQFKKEFYYALFTRVSVLAITLCAAYILRSYWALIIGVIARIVIAVSLSFVMCAYRPQLSLKRWRDMFSFSKWLMINNVLNFFQYRSGVLVVGSVAGPTGLGMYYLAEDIAVLITTELLTPIRQALFPGYSRISSDLGMMQRGFLQSQSIMLAIAAPFAVGMGLTAHLFVPLVLGVKWMTVVPLLQSLSIAGVFHILTANSVTLLVARGHPQRVTQSLLISVLVSVPLVVVGGIYIGLIGAVWGSVFGAALLAIIVTIMACRELDLAFSMILSSSWRSLLSLLAMAFVVRWIAQQTLSFDGLERLGVAPSAMQLFLSLSLAVCVGASVYSAVHLFAWRMQGCPRGAETRIGDFIGSIVARLRGQAEL